MNVTKYQSNKLLDLFRSKKVDTLIEMKDALEKYVYLTTNKTKNKQQELFRKDTVDAIRFNQFTTDVLMNGLKAAIIIFFSFLDEKQKRLNAGLESIKIGRKGDKIISRIR